VRATPRWAPSWLLAVATIVSVSNLRADVRLPSLLSDNMVIQAGVPTPVWGWAEAGEEIEVLASWSTTPVSVRTSADGRWRVQLEPPSDAGPHRLTIRGQNTRAIRNILCGETWLCAGQSNMAMTMDYRSKDDRGVLDYEREIAQANYPEIRYFIVSREKNASSSVPLEEAHGEWKICSPTTAGDFSGVGYYFAQRLHRTLNRPVGLIDNSWGGTYAQSWMSPEALAADPEYAPHLAWAREGLERAPVEKQRYQEELRTWQEHGADPVTKPIPPYWHAGHRNTPAGLYRARVVPLFGYPVKGVLWYQGEANAAQARLYEKLLPDLIGDWRRGWGRHDLPFLIVQLPSLGSPGSAPEVYRDSRWAELRDAQLRVSKRVRGTALAVTVDVGETHIHPRNKRPVGERLAGLALTDVYGHRFVSGGPVYDDFRVKGDRVYISFRGAGTKLATADGLPVRGFAVAGAERTFLPAHAELQGSSVVVWSEAVPDPAAVRYGWADLPDCTLVNAAGLPAGPFRTDRWISPSATATTDSAWPNEPVRAIGNRLELMVDRYLIDRMDGVDLRLNRPVGKGPVLTFDSPWDGKFSNYVTVLKDGSLYRMYYRGKPSASKDGAEDERTCYAESTDGIRWTKPNLGLIEVDGSRRNNAILDATAGPVPHNFTPFLDTRPGVPKTERFKALGGLFDMEGHRSSGGLVALVSEDGIRWKRLSETAVIAREHYPVRYNDAAMSPAFWSESENRYVAYIRTWKNDGHSTREGWGGNVRWIGRTTSADFLRWSPVEPMEFGNGVVDEQLYSSTTSPYFRAPHLSIGLAPRIVFNKPFLSPEEIALIGVDPRYGRDASEPVLLTTRGGLRYDRTFMEAWIRNGVGPEYWTSRNNYPALNIVPTGPKEMSIYVQQAYGQSNCRLERYTLETDRLASVSAPFAGGEFLTHPLTFSGRTLVLNMSASVAGWIRVEIQDAAGRALPGFSLKDTVEVLGNDIEKRVRWKSSGDLSALAGRPVRLRVLMKEADLYSLRFE